MDRRTAGQTHTHTNVMQVFGIPFQHVHNVYVDMNTTPSTHRTIQMGGSSPASLPNDLISFFSRFETDNTTRLEGIISSLKPAAA